MANRILQYDRVEASGSKPERTLFVLHGIYGAGRNWKSVVRNTVQARPDWGGVLVDLREHGDSQGFGPPHTLEAAAADLRRLVEQLEGEGGGILGHSFGGKVALAYAREFGEDLDQVWIIDSTPAAGEPGGAAWQMLDVLRRVPDAFESRREAVQAITDEGVARPVAQWVSANLERREGTYRWRIDFDIMEELLRDYFRSDLWSVIESPPEGLRMHVVKAEDSDVLSEADCDRIEAAGRENQRVSLHRVEGGHWLNADNPDALRDLLREHL